MVGCLGAWLDVLGGSPMMSSQQQRVTAGIELGPAIGLGLGLGLSTFSTILIYRVIMGLVLAIEYVGLVI